MDVDVPVYAPDLTQAFMFIYLIIIGANWDTIYVMIGQITSPRLLSSKLMCYYSHVSTIEIDFYVVLNLLSSMTSHHK